MLLLPPNSPQFGKPMLFPDAALSILREACWSPDAERTFEGMSGGFMWSAERLTDVASICSKLDNWAFRYVIAYRASLIRRKPRSELIEPWEQLRIACPDWPGFRPERSDPALEEALDAESDESLRQIEHLSKVWERAQRINAIRESRD